jgi:hypothetical protein
MLLATAVAPVAAWPQTEMDVTPTNQYIDGCPTALASWNVALWGGKPGTQFTVHVDYDNGTWTTRQVPGSVPWSYTYYFGELGCGPRDYTQDWSASRSGGGTAYDTTVVQANN